MVNPNVVALCIGNDYAGIQSKVGKGVFSSRSLYWAVSVLSPNLTKPSPPLPRRSSPQASHFHSKKLKIGPTELPSKYGTSRRADEEKTQQGVVPQCGWGANMTWHDVEWAVLWWVGSGWSDVRVEGVRLSHSQQPGFDALLLEFTPCPPDHLGNGKCRNMFKVVGEQVKLWKVSANVEKCCDAAV